MANTRRRNNIRMIEQQIAAVEFSRDKMLELAAQYKEVHPEYYDLFMRLADYLDKFPKGAKALVEIL